MSDAGEVLTRFYARLDGFEPGDAMDLVADEMEVAFNVPGNTFNGGRGALQDYIDGRDPTAFPRTHHVVESACFGPSALVLGEARRGDEVLGTFVAAAAVDDDGRLTRYLVTYEPGMTFQTIKTGA